MLFSSAFVINRQSQKWSFLLHVSLFCVIWMSLQLMHTVVIEKLVMLLVQLLITNYEIQSLSSRADFSFFRLIPPKWHLQPQPSFVSSNFQSSPPTSSTFSKIPLAGRHFFSPSTPSTKWLMVILFDFYLSVVSPRFSFFHFQITSPASIYWKNYLIVMLSLPSA